MSIRIFWRNGSTSQVIYVVAECDSVLIASFESTSTAVECVEGNRDIIIAPNPVKTGETIRINGDFDSEETDGMIVEIVKTDGTIVSRNYISMSPIEISGIYAAGTYFVRITTGTGKVYTVKLMVE